MLRVRPERKKETGQKKIVGASDSTQTDHKHLQSTVYSTTNHVLSTLLAATNQRPYTRRNKPVENVQRPCRQRPYQPIPGCIRHLGKSPGHICAAGFDGCRGWLCVGYHGNYRTRGGTKRDSYYLLCCRVLYTHWRWLR